MKFSKFAEYLEKLESSTKRNDLVAILAQLFKEVKPDEIDKVAYLLQCRVAPFYEPIELGMAGKMVEQAIARAYGVEREEAVEAVSRLGDEGLAAEKLNQEANEPLRVHGHVPTLAGTVARSKKQGAKNADLTVAQVFEILLDIAKTNGEGSVEKKIADLESLLKSVNPKSAKHIARIPIGKTRLGIGDATVLDALSYAKTGDKSLRADLEIAYNKTSDLGLVAKVFWEKGIDEVKKIKIQVGKPVRPALAERLPNAEQIVKRMIGPSTQPKVEMEGRSPARNTTETSVSKTGGKGRIKQFAVELKYDGFRTQIHKDGKNVRIYSRNLEDMTHMFPDLVEGVLKEVKTDKVIFEGEAIAYNVASGEFYQFQETTKRRRKYGIEDAITKLPLKMIAFDILYDGKDITQLTYAERRKKLADSIKKDSDVIIVAEEFLLSTEKGLTDNYNEALTRGLEGVMVKRLDGRYQAGARNFNWVKYKKMASGELSDTIDCVLLGYVYGTGKRTAFGVGALLVGVYDKAKDEFVSISRIGTGLTDEEWRSIVEMTEKSKVTHKPARVNSMITPSVWVEPKIVLEIFADEITRSPLHTAGKTETEAGYALRFPRVVSFRGTDKRAEDATTVDEVIKLYNAQKKVSR